MERVIKRRGGPVQLKIPPATISEAGRRAAGGATQRWRSGRRWRAADDSSWCLWSSVRVGLPYWGGVGGDAHRTTAQVTALSTQAHPPFASQSTAQRGKARPSPAQHSAAPPYYTWATHGCALLELSWRAVPPGCSSLCTAVRTSVCAQQSACPCLPLSADDCEVDGEIDCEIDSGL